MGFLDDYQEIDPVTMNLCILIASYAILLFVFLVSCVMYDCRGQYPAREDVPEPRSASSPVRLVVLRSVLAPPPANTVDAPHSSDRRWSEWRRGGTDFGRILPPPWCDLD